MRHYKITFEVPDDFDPENLELTASYKDEISIQSEGFTEDLTISESDVTKILDKLSFTKEDFNENSVVIFKFPDNIDSEALKIIRDTLSDKFADCPVLGLVDNIDVLVENSEQAIDMLNGMIAKVKLRAAVSETSKIVLR